MPIAEALTYAGNNLIGAKRECLRADMHPTDVGLLESSWSSLTRYDVDGEGTVVLCLPIDAGGYMHVYPKLGMTRGQALVYRTDKKPIAIVKLPIFVDGRKSND
jgi:hypothetical protein